MQSVSWARDALSFLSGCLFTVITLYNVGVFDFPFTAQENLVTKDLSAELSTVSSSSNWTSVLFLPYESLSVVSNRTRVPKSTFSSAVRETLEKSWTSVSRISNCSCATQNTLNYKKLLSKSKWFKPVTDIRQNEHDLFLKRNIFEQSLPPLIQNNPK